MKHLRAIEQGMAGEVTACLQRLPHLATLVDNPYEVGGNLSIRLSRVREHAVALARDHALDELGKAKDAAKDDDHARAARAKIKVFSISFPLIPWTWWLSQGSASPEWHSLNRAKQYCQCTPTCKQTHSTQHVLRPSIAQRLRLLLATAICAMGSSPSSAAGPTAVASRAWVVMPRPVTNLSGACDRGV